MFTRSAMLTITLLIGLIGGARLHAQEVGDSERIEITLDRHQRIIGWGTSLASWLGGNSVYTDERWRQAFIELGLNILRIDLQKEALVAPDGRYSTPVPITADLNANIERMDFRRSDVEIFGETALWLLGTLPASDEPLIVGSVWSPPHWMKGPTGTTQTWLGSTDAYPTPWLSGDHAQGGTPGTGDSIGGRLRTEDPAILEAFGRYLAAWVIGFERTYDVPLHAISIQNESTFENPFDSMVMNIDADGNEDFSQYATALSSVRRAWNEYGVNARIKGPHVAQIGPTPDNPWSLRQQLGYIDAVRQHGDGSLLDFISYYNSNYYMSADESGAMATAGYYAGRDSVPAPWASWAPLNGVAGDGKPIWFSETGGADSDWKTNGDDKGALELAVKIQNALLFADAAAYIYWQLSDGAESASEHTLLGNRELDYPEDSAKYTLFKHFSHFVRPGAERVTAQFDNGRASKFGHSDYDLLNALSVSCFVHEVRHSLTCILLNATDAAQSTTLDIPQSLLFTRYEIRTSSADQRWARQTPGAGNAALREIVIPPRGIVTVSAYW